MTTMTTRHDTDFDLLDALRAFILSRPGFDPYNYSSRAGLQSDQRRAARDKADALRMLDYVERDHYGYAEPVEYLPGALTSAFSGRLSWDGERLDYCTGQYYPTEYRAAACAVLALAIYRAWRADEGDAMTWDRAYQRAGNRWGWAFARRHFRR